jgi:hypothetical protein
MAHAPFSPSSAKRWLTCPGSFALSLQIPEPPSSAYASEGTRLHDVAARILQFGAVLVTDDDMQRLLPYTQHCFALIDAAEWHEIETTIMHSELLYGTPDFVAQVGDTLHVVDLKTGAGLMVFPTENDQALAYAYMALVRYESVGATMPTKVVLTIVQPTDEEEPVKSWTTTVDHVMDWGVRAEAAMRAALAGSSELVPGEHCRWCKAKPSCPKLRGLAVGIGVQGALNPSELSPTDTADILERADLVLQFIDAVREHGHDLATRGVDVPGWTLKPKRAMRAWSSEERVLEIARRRKIKIWQDKLMSPAMAEKAHPNLPKELADEIVSVSSGTNLVRGKSAVHVALPSDASKVERLMANFELLNYRK